MKLVVDYFRDLASDAWTGWNRFWFAPSDAATLGVIRICAGLMLFYTHLVWSVNLEEFFGPYAWVSAKAHQAFLDGGSIPPETTEAIVPSMQTPEAGPMAGGEARANFGPQPSPAPAPGAGLPIAGPSLPGAGGNPPTVLVPGDVEELPPAEPIRDPMWKPTHFWLIQNSWQLWTAHILALGVFLLMTAGVCTRVTTVLAYLLTVSYAHRVPGALFGLDQINAMLALYLAIGPSGAAYSFDQWRARRKRLVDDGEPRKFVTATVATRLIQLHMCLIYFMAGAGKLMGESWWDGTAMWMSFANAEYQTLDMTFLKHYPVLLAVMCHITVMWELSFCVFVWNLRLRPIILSMAVVMHLGIGICLGMMTFGLVMLIGCTSFITPTFIRRLIDRQPPADDNDEPESTESDAKRDVSKRNRNRRPNPGRGPRSEVLGVE